MGIRTKKHCCEPGLHYALTPVFFVHVGWGSPRKSFLLCPMSVTRILASRLLAIVTIVPLHLACQRDFGVFKNIQDI